MGDRTSKAVPSSGNTGPRDFSAAVRANFASRPPQPHITVQIWLSGEEAEKVTRADVSAAVSELLARLGVDRGQVEVCGLEDP
jgi:hypothetical protein